MVLVLASYQFHTLIQSVLVSLSSCHVHLVALIC